MFNSIAISAGYQYLEAKDKDILSQIESGKMYKRDPITYQSSVVKKADYFVINNRSKHTINTKILWTNEAKGWNAFVRFVYRGKFGFTDVNGNNIADDQRELVHGFWMTNIAASKNINQKITTNGIGFGIYMFNKNKWDLGLVLGIASYNADNASFLKSYAEHFNSIDPEGANYVRFMDINDLKRNHSQD